MAALQGGKSAKIKFTSSLPVPGGGDGPYPGAVRNRRSWWRRTTSGSSQGPRADSAQSEIQFRAWALELQHLPVVCTGRLQQAEADGCDAGELEEKEMDTNLLWSGEGSYTNAFALVPHSRSPLASLLLVQTPEGDKEEQCVQDRVSKRQSEGSGLGPRERFRQCKDTDAPPVLFSPLRVLLSADRAGRRSTATGFDLREVEDVPVLELQRLRKAEGQGGPRRSDRGGSQCTTRRAPPLCQTAHHGCPPHLARPEFQAGGANPLRHRSGAAAPHENHIGLTRAWKWGGGESSTNCSPNAAGHYRKLETEPAASHDLPP